MELIAQAAQGAGPAPETPEESDEADLHKRDSAEKEPDRAVHPFRHGTGAAETDRAGRGKLRKREHHENAHGDDAVRGPRSAVRGHRSLSFRNALPAYATRRAPQTTNTSARSNAFQLRDTANSRTPQMATHTDSAMQTAMKMT